MRCEVPGTQGLLGIHVNLPAGVAAMSDSRSAESEKERAAQKAAATFRASGFGYFLEQSTRPQTIGYSLLNFRAHKELDARPLTRTVNTRFPERSWRV